MPHRVRRIADVEQQAVAAAGAAGEADRRIDGDVVALRRARRAAAPAVGVGRPSSAIDRRAALRAARRCRRRSARRCRRAPSRCCRASARRTARAATCSSPSIVAVNPPVRLRVGDRLRVCGDVLRRLAVRRRRRQVVEDARRADDRRLLGCASGTLMTSMRNSAEFGILVRQRARRSPAARSASGRRAEPEM